MAYTPVPAGTENWDVPLNQALSDIDDTAEDAMAGDGTIVDTLETTTSTAYTDLATVGPSVTVTLTSPRTVAVLLSSRMRNAVTSDDVYQAFTVSGATTAAPSNSAGTRHNGSGALQTYTSTAVVACNAGTTTFTSKYRVDGGTGEYSLRVIAALVL